VASHRVYYKGEGGGFPQVRAVVSLVCSCSPWFVLVPKVLKLCTNHFVWVVCKPVWVSDACQLFLVPSRSSNTPLYPSKCCELRSVPWLLLLPMSSIWTHIWILQGVGSASNLVFKPIALQLGFFIALKEIHPNTKILLIAFSNLKPWFVRHMKEWNTCCYHYHTELVELRIGLNNMRSNNADVHGNCPCKCIDICSPLDN
jgi:hypothetical protein